MRRAVGALAVLFGAMAAVASGPAYAAGGQELAPKLEGRALLEALAKGGYVLLMRHTATNPVYDTPESVVAADCATQRNLSQEGKQQAVDLGRAFAQLGIRVDGVLSSPYCRCVETGTLAFGSVMKSEDLTVGDDLSTEDKKARGALVRKMLSQAPEPGFNTVLITHTGTFLYTFGLDPTPEGITHVFRPLPVGPPSYVGRLVPADWVEVAASESAAAP